MKEERIKEIAERLFKSLNYGLITPFNRPVVDKIESILREELQAWTIQNREALNQRDQYHRELQETKEKLREELEVEKETALGLIPPTGEAHHHDAPPFTQPGSLANKIYEKLYDEHCLHEQESFTLDYIQSVINDYFKVEGMEERAMAFWLNIRKKTDYAPEILRQFALQEINRLKSQHINQK